LIVIEGVGTGRLELAEWLDALLWVQADQTEIERRESIRLQTGEVSESAQKTWLREEIPFLADQRPWERANLFVAGEPELSHDHEVEFVVSDPPGV
jgi:hypothetical protein